MRYRLILFDFDGTLADTLWWFLDAFNQVAEGLRLERIEPEAFEPLRSLDTVALMKRLGIPLWKVPKIARRMRSMMAGETSRMKLFPGIPEMLSNLHQSGAALGLLTSNTLENVEAVLGAERMSRMQQVECGVSLLGKASKLKKLLKQARVSPAETIFVGDEVRDVEAAKTAGVASGAVLWGYHSEALLRRHSPSFCFSSPTQLVQQLA